MRRTRPVAVAVAVAVAVPVPVPVRRPVALALALAAVTLCLSPDRSSAQPKPAPAIAARPAGDGASSARRVALDGTTHDYGYPLAPGDESPQESTAPRVPEVPPERAWFGRAFVHRLAAADRTRPLPILVFLHGLNEAKIKYRWLGGGDEGDVRRIAAELMEAGLIPPILVAAPSVIHPRAATIARTSWPEFDLDTFLDVTARRLRGIATLERTRVIVAGHSGGACNNAGGLVRAVQAAVPVHAALAIDTCMDLDVAASLARTRPTTHVIVSWQAASWAGRPFTGFQRTFRHTAAQQPAASGVLRQLEQLQPSAPRPHDAMVSLVLRRWLPSLLSSEAAPSVPCVSP